MKNGYQGRLKSELSVTIILLFKTVLASSWHTIHIQLHPKKRVSNGNSQREKYHFRGLLGWAGTQSISNAGFWKLTTSFIDQQSCMGGSISWVCLLKPVRTELTQHGRFFCHRYFTQRFHVSQCLRALHLHPCTPRPVPQALGSSRVCLRSHSTPPPGGTPNFPNFSGSLLRVKKTCKEHRLRRGISQQTLMLVETLKVALPSTLFSRYELCDSGARRASGVL